MRKLLYDPDTWVGVCTAYAEIAKNAAQAWGVSLDALLQPSAHRGRPVWHARYDALRVFDSQAWRHWTAMATVEYHDGGQTLQLRP